MSEKRIQFNNVVQNQLPLYVQSDYPLVAEFLKSYYQGQEYQGGPIDLVQNIDEYIKVDKTTNLTSSVGLGASVGISSETISVDMQNYPTGTDGFPSSYGLLKINDEIITYTGITTFAFTGCVRGFVGVTSYKSLSNPEELVFETSTAAEHDKGDSIQNLSSLFLKEFLVKTKHQLTPGLEGRTLTSNLNQNVFVKQAKDFYLSKGTDRGFEILFKALYDENVKVIRPSQFLFTPSNANYKITNDLVIEPIVGDPMDLELSTLYQNTYDAEIGKAYAPITHIESIQVSTGTTFYKLSMDAGYNRDSRVEGSTYGAFAVHPKTQIIGEVGAGATVIDVDSTVGFTTNGELQFRYVDNTIGITSYTSKNLTQFFGLSGIGKTIADTTTVGVNTFAYGQSNKDSDEIVEVRITSVLNHLKYNSKNHLYGSGDTVKIKTLGVKDTGFRAKKWFYNVAPTYKVKTIVLKDTSDWTYEISLNVDHDFKVGDKAVAVLIGSDGRELPVSNITQLTSSKSFIIKGQGEINTDLTYTIKRNILKTHAINFPNADIYSTNIQNLYKDAKEDKTLVSSSSIPTYGSQSLGVNNGTIQFSGTYSGDTFKIVTPSTKTPAGVPIQDHGFYTGDAVYYTPQIVNDPFVDPTSGTSIDNFVVRSGLFDGTVDDEGLYFVERVNETTVKFAKSRTDLGNGKYLTTNTGFATDNKVSPYKLHGKTLQSQKLLRELLPPENSGTVYTTHPGKTGIFINGVEILNYKSYDQVYHGKLESIDVLAPGKDYDVVNPPILRISDNVGTGATGNVAVSGELKEIRITDPGYDYPSPPTIKISGGNGSGARATVNMEQTTHQSAFNASSPLVGLGTTGTLGSTIGFTTFHKFRNAEQIIYVTDNQDVVTGLTTSASYWVSLVGTGGTAVRLHTGEAGALAGINTVTLTARGIGKQYLQSYNKKSIIESINVVDSGSGYSNKKLEITPAGINTSLSTVNITNHGYNSGEIIKYTCNGTPVAGLTTSTDFYVTKVDDDSFRLSSVGVGTTSQDFYYKTDQYREFTSVGVGTHIFNYQDITVSLVGGVGISSIGGETFQAKIQPIFRGEITSINLTDNGVGYGSSDVINFNREPDLVLSSGVNAQLKPVIDQNGSIIEVIVENKGKDYISNPDLSIIGDGRGAVLVPITRVLDLNGNESAVGIGTSVTHVLDEVKVIQKGTGYGPETAVNVIAAGSQAQLRPNIQKWSINLFEKYYQTQQIVDDDGFAVDGLNKEYGLQYVHLYAPRKLRESVYAQNQEGKSIYGEPDLRKVNGIETPSENHSPIIGWAYDGNPIYGPYGYVKKDGGVVTLMRSGYDEEAAIKENRPPLNIFPPGFFVEDYTFKGVLDESVLDENNGRFCVTPEFPNGTYAYFATISELSAQQGGKFNNYKLPVFPYLIGKNYYSTPNDFNYLASSNQDDYLLNGSDWCRNTLPYNLIEGDEQYEYMPLPDKLSQTVDVTGVQPGMVDSIGIETGGKNYQIDDKVVFNNEGTNGIGVAAVVSRLHGKQVSSVSVATSTLTGVEIYPSNQRGIYEISADEPINWVNTDIISVSGLSTTSSKIEGVYVAGISSNSLSLAGIGTTAVAIGTDGATGIVTHIDVYGDVRKTTIKSNDILGIGTEQIKVLNVESDLSRLRVLRAVNGVTGVSHTVTTVVLEDPRRLTINAGFNSTFDYRTNQQIYFEPKESVGIQTLSGVGIGSTLAFSNPGIGLTQLFVNAKQVYLPDHGLKTGDVLTYSPNGGTGISIWQDGKAGAANGITTLTDGQTLYAAVITDSIIGLSTCKVGLGSTGTFVGIASTQRDSTTFFFAGVGTGVYHSLKTNYSIITGEISRITATVSTAQTHGLLNNEYVYMDVNPGLNTTRVVKYNDFNRRIIVDSKVFAASGVNTTSNAITINDHGFYTGEKIIYTGTNPPEGLSDNGVYYIVKVDSDTFKLTDTYHESIQPTPNIVGLGSTSSGTINPVNPPLHVYKNANLIFDLSDSSLKYTHQSTEYTAFKLNFYTDQNFSKVWDTSQQSSKFNVSRETDKVTLSVTDDIPTTLYYKLDPIYESTLPEVKKQIVVDADVISGNSLEVLESLYNGKQKITVASTSSFTYTLSKIPERVSYGSTSNLSYDTDSTTAYGEISQFELKNNGKNYYTLPGISTINTEIGSGAIIEAKSTSIGKIKKVKINNIGYNFPTDTTLKPNTILPQVCMMDALKSIESVGITSFGRGYVSAPELLVFDGKTGKRVNDIDLKYTLGNPEVEILKNTYGISDAPPRIVPDRNSNGVGISTVGFNTVNYDVTLSLSVGFSTADSFPFAVGDNIYVEGVSVGVASTGRGYNSKEYDYGLFTVTAIDANYGGIGSITYNLTDYFEDLAPGSSPGTYDWINSVGRVVPERYFPHFAVQLKSNDFVPGEIVTGSISSVTGEVEHWNANTGILRISSNDNFVINDVIEGESTRTQGIASSIKTFDSYLKTAATSRVEGGWETDSGFFNRTLQRVQDSDYYQNLSYSLSSRIDMDTWDDPVSTLNHTIGFKKFSDYQLESKPDDKESLVVGLSTELSDFSVVNDLYETADINCVYDFDLVKENEITIGSDKVSTEITFNNRILQDYSESIGNRVVSIDDFSGDFNSNPRATRYSIVNQFTLSDRRALKYITYVRDKRFTAQRQLMVVDVLHDGVFAYINQYGRNETVYDQGSFDFAISGDEGQLLFYPVKYSVNDYWIASLSFNLDDNLLSTGSTVVGRGLVDTESASIGTGIGTTTIVGIASTYRSAHVMVSINPDINYNEYEYTQFNIVHDGDEVEIQEYGRLITTPGDFVTTGMGTYRGYIDGSSLKVDFIPNSSVGIGTTGVINTMLVGMASSEYTGIGTCDLKHAKIQSGTTAIAAAGSPTENIVAEFDSGYEAAYCYVQVTDITNKAYEMSELVVVTDYEEGETQETFDVDWGNAQLGVGYAGLGTIGSRVSTAGTVSILYTPNANIETQVNVFMNALKIQDDTKDTISLENGAIESGFGNYEGTESSVKKSFPLNHKTDTIFTKAFLGADSSIVDVDNNTISLPNHFFVTGEQLTYAHAGSGTTMAIGIASTNGFAGVGTTSLLPGNVFAVKIDDDTIKVAETAAKALKTVPEVVDITSVGIGTSHRFTSQNQNSKVMVSLDNIIQSPIVSTSVTTHLSDQVFTTDDIIKAAGITSFYGADLIQIGSEIMRIDAVGIGTLPNAIRVRRPWAGTALAGYGTGTLITKVIGNYNIVDNTLNFVEAPYGNVPLSTTTNQPDDRDWVGIATGSSFQGRTFMRSGVPDTTNETYYRNYIFDSLTAQFTGQQSDFNLQSEGSAVSGLTTDNAIILVNDIFQTPGSLNEYTLEEGSAGVTTISFTGTGSSVAGAPNVGNLPLGGVIVSVGSTEGFGYQPLVAAGGTVTVSAGGTIKSISIGNTGSGYRAGIQTVNVGIQTLSRTGTNIIGIGTAQVTTGHITGIAVTNMNHLFYSPRKVANVGYSSVTGITTVTTQTNHGLSVSDEIRLSGIAFTCDYAGRLGISTAVYDNSSGIMTVTTASAHGLATSGNSSNVIFTGLAFTCGLDAGASRHYYPRGEDRAYNTAVQLTKDGAAYTLSDAVYNPTTGIMTCTVASHGFSNGDKVKFGLNSLTFTCDKDSHGSEHTYPRESDTIAGQWITISNVTTNTFRVNVLPVAPSTNTGVHTFVRAATDGLTYNDGNIAIDVGYAAPGDEFTHQFVSASSGAITAGSPYAHRYVSSVNGAVTSGGNYNHTFVSAGIGSLNVVGVGTTTATDATYDASTGELVLTITGHSYSVNDTVGIDTGSIVFTCAMDSYTTNKSYPRSGDPVGYPTAITAVDTNTITVNVGISTLVTHNVTDATYNADTGALVLTIPSHGLDADTSVRLKQDSLSFRCAMDDYATIHTYPRYTDPGFSTAINIDSKTSNTITLNVGTSKTANYSISTATYNASVGILTVAIGAGHSLLKGQSIKIGTESLNFRCSRDNYATVHRYPRKPDPYYTGTPVTAVNSTTQFEVNVGVTTVPTFYVGFGSVQAAIQAPRKSNNSVSGFDPAIDGSEVLRVVDSKTFEINSGVSTRNHIYARGGVVEGYSKVVFDDPLSYAGIALTYTSDNTGIGTGAEIDVVVGQGSSIISFTITKTGSAYGNGEKLTVPIGGNTGIPTDPSKTFTEFHVEIEKVFSDEFTGWSVGQLQVTDNVERYIDGSRVDFPLTVNGDTLSIVAKKGSKIIEQDLLLVFVNNVPQVPGKGYKFPGGSTVTFTEAPKVGDTIEIIFYKGTGSEDVVERSVLETVKQGDSLTIGRLETQDTWLQETVRVPLSVNSTDLVKTPPYYGPGNSGDSDLARPVVWCRQTEDKIINEKGVGKDREIYEPVINPRSNIIKSVGVGSTSIYVESLRPFFDPQDEVLGTATVDFTFQKKVKFISQENRSVAIGTALVSGIGTISSVAISDGGVGYSTATVSFATTSLDGTEVGVGSTSTTAFGSPIIGAAGTITGIAITSVGAGYTSSNPPALLISPPTWSEEENKITSYTGDDGIVVGFGTTTVGVSTGYQLIFDLHIPLSSDLRNSTIAGTAVTISGISTGDYFVINDSNVGSSTTSIRAYASDGATIGIGSAFVDNVYEVNNFEIVNTATGIGSSGVGIGTSHVKRVFVKIGDNFTWSGDWPSFSGVGIQTGNYFGSYSWGKIILPSRSESNSYNAYTDGGVGGISTSMVVRRSAALKFKNFKSS